MTTRLRQAGLICALLFCFGFASTLRAQTSPTITTTSPLPPGIQNLAYSEQLQFTGGSPTSGTFWFESVQPGQTGLPPGTFLNSGSGLIGGTPTSTGTFTFRVNLSAGGSTFKDFALTISPPIQFTTPSPLPDAQIGTPYSVQLQTSGGNGSPTFTAGTALPGGLSLSSSGLLSGTPTGPSGTASFRVTVRDATPAANGGPSAAATTYTVSVVPQPLIFNPSSPLPNGVQGAAYSYAFGTSVSNGVPPYTYLVTAGALPAGLSLNSTTGQLSGTIPATAPAGPYNFSVTVTDSDEVRQSVTRALVLSVRTPLVINTTSLPDGVQNQNYSATITASGGDQPSRFSFAGGTLPNGVTLGSNGTLSGTPTNTGTFTFNVLATDSGTPNQQQVPKSLTLRINPPLVFSTANPLPNAVINTPYSTTIAFQRGIGYKRRVSD